MPPQRARDLNLAMDRVIRNVFGIGSTDTRISAKGLHFSQTPSNPQMHQCTLYVNYDKPNDLPKINANGAFSNPNGVPIISTIVNVDRYRFFIAGYLDASLPQNPNVNDVFPYLPWNGEIVIFSMGRRVRILSRLAAPRYVVHKAISVYIRAVMEARLCNRQLPKQVTFTSCSVFLV